MYRYGINAPRGAERADSRVDLIQLSLRDTSTCRSHPRQRARRSHRRVELLFSLSFRLSYNLMYTNHPSGYFWGPRCAPGSLDQGCNRLNSHTADFDVIAYPTGSTVYIPTAHLIEIPKQVFSILSSTSTSNVPNTQFSISARYAANIPLLTYPTMIVLGRNRESNT